MPDRQDYSKESARALGRIPAKGDGIAQLESACTRWLYEMEMGKWPRALQYFENASYLQGNHLTRFYYTADAGFGFHTFGLHDSNQFDTLVAKVIDNRLIRPTETAVSMLSGDGPEPRVTPNSDLPEDEDAAALSELLLQLLFEDPIHLPEMRQEAALGSAMFGTVAFETEYGETDDPVVVPAFRNEKRPNPLWEEGDPDEDRELTTQVQSGTKVEYRKDFMGRVWTPFHLTVDPEATHERNLNWISRNTFEDIDWIKDNFDRDEKGFFPERLEGITQESGSRYTLYWYAKIQDIIEHPQYFHHGGGLAPQTFTHTGGYAPNQTYFSTIDVKPTPEFPRGRTLVLSGGKLIYAGDARAWSEKYPRRWHRYRFHHWFKVNGKFWGVPLLSMLVPLQKRINAIDALVQSNREYMSIGQWLIPKHSKLADGRTSGIPGENVTYTDVPGMNKPERVRHEPLPAELLAERAELKESIDSLAASSVLGDKISRSAARSGPILDFLRREKLQSKDPMIRSYQRAVEGVGKDVLMDAQLNLIEGDKDLEARLRQAAREHSSLTIKDFTSASLRDHHAVKIDIAAEIRNSPEADQAKAESYMGFRGAAATPQEVQMALRAMGLDKYVQNQENSSVSRARRMIARIIQGQEEAAFPMPGIDVPMVMAPIFKDFLLSDKFHDVPDEAKFTLVSLADYYIEQAEEEQRRQMMMFAAMQGAGGPAPEPGAGPGPGAAEEEV